MKTPRVYQPRQRTDGRWEYWVLEDGVAPHVVGYCAGWHFDDGEPLDADAHARTRAEVEHLKLKYHTEGHDTEELARRCFNEYLLETSLNHKDKEEQQACITCGEETSRVVFVARLHRWPICVGHDTRTTVAALLAQQATVREEIDDLVPLSPPAPRKDKRRGTQDGSADRAPLPGPLAPAKASGSPSR